MVGCDPPMSNRHSFSHLPLLLLLLLALAVATPLACCHRPRGSSDLGGAAGARLDPELREAALRLLAGGHGDETLPVLVRVARPEARAALEAAGMRVDSLVGNVASGTVPARALAGVAGVADVVRIEPARRLEGQ